MKLFKLLLPLGIIAVFIAGIWYSLKTEPHLVLADKSLKSPQDAGVPLGLVKTKPLATYDELFDVIGSFDRLQIPLATRFDSPVGDVHGAFSYNAQKFMVMNEKRGGFHLGDDWNGIGGQDSDFGDPIYSAADGLVVYSGFASAGWGNVMITAHRLTDGRIVQCLYGHLAVVRASVGDLVARGQTIGTMGSADGAYFAHLHFEMRESDGVYVGGGYKAKAKDGKVGEYIDPSKFFADYNKHKEDDFRTSPLKLMLEQEAESRLMHLKGEALSQSAQEKEDSE